MSKIYFLRDISEDCIDAVIIATTSTKKEIEDAINKAKLNDDSYTWDDIVAALPKDCEIFDRWNEEEIYY